MLHISIQRRWRCGRERDDGGGKKKETWKVGKTKEKAKKNKSKKLEKTEEDRKEETEKKEVRKEEKGRK